MELLDWSILQPGRVRGGDVPGPPQRLPRLSRLTCHPTPQLQCRLNGRCPCLSYPMHPR